MTNITKNNTSKDMQLHIDKAYVIIDAHLPFHYTDAVLAKFPKESGITSGMIRNVKKKLNKRIDILNAMVEVALENKQIEENFKQLIA